MTLQLNHELERLIESRLRAGKYASVEDVVRAALRSLEQDEARGQFDASEWDRLLAEGESGGRDIDGESVLDEIKNLRRQAQGS